VEPIGQLPDGELLARFTARQEEAAFAALVQRHGRLVFGVCRRVLHDWHEAEDAFQATFLVLARKANTVGRGGAVGAWLHRVAYRVALKAKARSANRQRRERQAGSGRCADPLAEVTGRELLEALDEEVQRLPEDYRAPLVLCYLEGRTAEEAARQLGCGRRTLQRRLEQGRKGLRDRLRRRGLTLPAALLTLGLTRADGAAVPATWTAATVRAALAARTGPVATAAGALAEAVLRGMTVPRAKILAALLVLGTLVFGTGVLAHQAQAQRPDAPAPAAAPPAPRPAKGAEDDKKAAVTGRVLNADGQPVAGARVAGYAGLEFGSLSVQYQAKGLGEVRTDAEGRFRLPAPTAPGEHFRDVELLAGAKGYGPAWSRAVPVGGADVTLRLPPEAAVVGRLIDLQGEPVARAKLRAVRVIPETLQGPPFPQGVPPAKVGEDLAKMAPPARRQEAFEFRKDSPLKESSLWPAPVTTDAEGRFRLGGFGRGQEVHLVVEDDRFARQEIIVKAGAKEQRHALLPPYKVTGRVVTADTTKPVADAWVGITSFRDFQGHLADGRTDADGRFAVNAYPGESYTVQVFPQHGEPYLAASRSGDWPRGAVKQEVNIKLPRGAAVHGKVVEAGTGKALVSASVAFIPRREKNPLLPPGIVTGADHKAFTGADGTFRVVVPPGPGRLVVTGPDGNYAYDIVIREPDPRELAGDWPQYFHAVVPLDLRATDRPKEVKVELRRSVTLQGRVVGPDGKPVKDAVVFVPSELLPVEPTLSIVVGVPIGIRFRAITARDGAFELPNCDPARTYRIYVLSSRPAAGGVKPLPAGARLNAGALAASSVVNGLIAQKDPLGAVAEVSAKAAAGKPIEVKLARCESAEVRFVDARGKAVRQKVWLELLVKPGPPAAKAGAEAALLASPYSLVGEKSPVEPDADGRIAIPGLIPGATYRLKVLTGDTPGLESETIFEKDFTVEAGKKVKLDLPAPEAR
jgi:RNA polymerase sigma factor (sigma-70 family)